MSTYPLSHIFNFSKQQFILQINCIYKSVHSQVILITGDIQLDIRIYSYLFGADSAKSVLQFSFQAFKVLGGQSPKSFAHQMPVLYVNQIYTTEHGRIKHGQYTYYTSKSTCYCFAGWKFAGATWQLLSGNTVRSTKRV